MLPRTSGIYKIINTINNKFYIGSAKSFYERWHSHKHYLKNNNHDNDHLQRAWNKYGEAAFRFEIIEEVFENILSREQYWIDTTNCCNSNIGYNIRRHATSNLGLKFTNEHKAKLSAWQIGIPKSEEVKLRISKALKGRKLSKETIEKMTASRRKQNNAFLCKDGWKCTCDRCKNDRRVYQRNYMKAKRAKTAIS